MEPEQIKEILGQLVDHESRLQRLEILKTKPLGLPANVKAKQKTLNEIIKGKSLESGQQKVTAVIGYYEKILDQAPVKGSDIPALWKKSKLDGKYRTIFIARAVKDGLVRDLEDGGYDLSTGGEFFFDKLLNNESTDKAFK